MHKCNLCLQSILFCSVKSRRGALPCSSPFQLDFVHCIMLFSFLQRCLFRVIHRSHCVVSFVLIRSESGGWDAVRDSMPQPGVPNVAVSTRTTATMRSRTAVCSVAVLCSLLLMLVLVSIHSCFVQFFDVSLPLSAKCDYCMLPVGSLFCLYCWRC